jgi:hypothetical protein
MAEAIQLNQNILFLVTPGFKCYTQQINIVFSNEGRSKSIIGVLNFLSTSSQNPEAKPHNIKQSLTNLQQDCSPLYKYKEVDLSSKSSQENVRETIKSWIRLLTLPVVVYVDISQLPEEMLLVYIELFGSLMRKGQISKFFILYTWSFIDQVINTVGDYLRLEFGVSNGNSPQCCRIPVSTHLTKMIDKTVDSDVYSVSSNSQTDIYVFLDKYDPLSFFRTVYTDRFFLYQITHTASIHYFYSIARGHQVIMQGCVNHAKYENTPKKLSRSIASVNSVTLFGPKPLVISGYIAGQMAALNGKVIRIDFLNTDMYTLRDTQHNDLVCFEVDLGAHWCEIYDCQSLWR